MASTSDTNVSPIIEAFYQYFLLRDVFAKIVPGFFVISSFTWIWQNSTLFAYSTGSLSWYLVFVGIGLCWLLGFAIQSFGEAIGAVKHCPDRYKDDDKRYRLRILFSNTAARPQRQQVERYTIVKEATGNGATALIILQALVIVKAVYLLALSDDRIPTTQILAHTAMILIIFAPLMWALLKSSASHRDKQYKYMEMVEEMSSAEPSS